jgi:hypothetical protein
MFRWLKHAFATKPAQAELTPQQQSVVDRVCHAVVARKMTTPALAFLEMSRPLNYISSQAIHFFTPILSALVDTKAVECFATVLERRDAVDILCTRIEQIEKAVAKSGSEASGESPAEGIGS